jgi:hypothetical protein
VRLDGVDLMFTWDLLISSFLENEEIAHRVYQLTAVVQTVFGSIRSLRQ